MTDLDRAKARAQLWNAVYSDATTKHYFCCRCNAMVRRGWVWWHRLRCASVTVVVSW